MKIKEVLAATVITVWSSMAAAAFVTTFGQNKSTDSSFPLTFYPEAVTARNNFVGGGAPSFFDFEAPEVAVGATTLSVNLDGMVATLSGAGGVKRNNTGVTNSGL